MVPRPRALSPGRLVFVIATSHARASLDGGCTRAGIARRHQLDAAEDQRHRLRAQRSPIAARRASIPCSAQTRPPDEILVIDNASDGCDTRNRGARSRGTGRGRAAQRAGDGSRDRRGARRGDILVYLDADCRAPLTWLELIERRFERDRRSSRSRRLTATTTGTGWAARSSGPTTSRSRRRPRCSSSTCSARHHLLRRQLRRAAGGAGGIGGFDTTIEFHGEDTNLGRRLYRVGQGGPAGLLDLDVGPALSWRWEPARCSGCTCATSGPRCSTTVRRTPRISM